MTPAIRRKELLCEQVPPAVLEVIALFAQFADATIRRANAINLIANVLRILPGEDFLSALRVEFPGDKYGDLPFIASFKRTWPRDFGTIYDPAFGTRFRAAASLLIA